MSLTVYKISSYLTWKTGSATFPGGSGGGSITPIPPVDLSNYYTKVNLQTAGQSIVNYSNLSGEPTFDMSIEASLLNSVTLVNDEENPGNSKLYGTNAYGNKGWYDQSAGGAGDVTVSGTPVDNQVAIWVNASTIEGTAGLTYDGNTLGIAGDISITGGEATGGDFILSSDKHLKKNIEDLRPEKMEVKYKTFRFKSKEGQMRFGVIAQDIIDKYPELVRVGKDGMLSVSYFDLLVREIVYLKSKIAELESKIR